MIHTAQRYLFERNLIPTISVHVDHKHTILQYLPQDTTLDYTLDEYRAMLSVALRNVRAQFVEKEAEKREAAKKEKLEMELLKKEALKKVSSGTTLCGHRSATG